MGDTLIMLDAGLDLRPTLNFLPLTLVNSSHFQSLRDWSPRTETRVENVSVFYSFALELIIYLHSIHNNRS